ncbi:MAG: UTRA domain-containing protein [Acholeplasmataceae bacterium]
MILLDLIKIDKRFNSHKSDQIFMAILDLIKNKVIKNCDILPNPADLANHLNLCVCHVEEAYKLLAEYHYIKKENENYIIYNFEINSNLFTHHGDLEETIISAGKTPSTQLLYAKNFKTDEKFYEQSKYEKNEQIFEIKHLFCGDGIPVFIVYTYISLTRFPDFKEIFIDTPPFSEAFNAHYNFIDVHSLRHIKVIPMPQKESKLLNELPGTAVYMGACYFYDENEKQVGYLEIITSSHFSFTFDIPI